MKVFSEYYGQKKEITLRCTASEKQILNRFRNIIESQSPKTFDIEIDKNAHDLGWLFRRGMRQRMKRMKFDFVVPKVDVTFKVANDMTIVQLSINPSQMPIWLLGSLIVTVGLFFGILGAALAGEDELVYILLVPYLLTAGPTVQIIRMTSTWQKRAEKILESLVTCANGKVL